MFLSFARGSSPSTDNSDGRFRLSEADNQQPAVVRVANDNLSRFLARMLWVVEETWRKGQMVDNSHIESSWGAPGIGHWETNSWFSD